MRHRSSQRLTLESSDQKRPQLATGISGPDGRHENEESFGAAAGQKMKRRVGCFDRSPANEPSTELLGTEIEKCSRGESIRIQRSAGSVLSDRPHCGCARGRFAAEDASKKI
jgi:hypothetical protein